MYRPKRERKYLSIGVYRPKKNTESGGLAFRCFTASHWPGSSSEKGMNDNHESSGIYRSSEKLNLWIFLNSQKLKRTPLINTTTKMQDSHKLIY